jgi:rare lipoprotein A
MILKLACAGTLVLGLSAPARSETVRASWYGGGGERLNPYSADGSLFNPRALTAAHRTLPFGTRLRVCRATDRRETGVFQRPMRCVVVRVNDRGPARWTGRVLDLSRAAAAVLGLTRIGVGVVSIERL